MDSAASYCFKPMSPRRAPPPSVPNSYSLAPPINPNHPHNNNNSNNNNSNNESDQVLSPPLTPSLSPSVSMNNHHHSFKRKFPSDVSPLGFPSSATTNYSGNSSSASSSTVTAAQTLPPPPPSASSNRLGFDNSVDRRTSTCSAMSVDDYQHQPYWNNVHLQKQRSMSFSERMPSRRQPSKQNKHVCTYPRCGWSFKRYEHLKRHMLVHTGERPHACPYPGCGKRFSRSDNFHAHYRTHTKKAMEQQKRDSVSSTASLPRLPSTASSPGFPPPPSSNYDHSEYGVGPAGTTATQPPQHQHYQQQHHPMIGQDRYPYPHPRLRSVMTDRQGNGYIDNTSNRPPPPPPVAPPFGYDHNSNRDRHRQHMSDGYAEQNSSNIMSHNSSASSSSSDEEKQHVCTHPDCHRRFKRLEHLKRHMRIHTLERPFPCTYPGCQKTFSRSDNLTQHLKTHERREGRYHHRMVPEEHNHRGYPSASPSPQQPNGFQSSRHQQQHDSSMSFVDFMRPSPSSSPSDATFPPPPYQHPASSSSSPSYGHPDQQHHQSQHPHHVTSLPPPPAATHHHPSQQQQQQQQPQHQKEEYRLHTPPNTSSSMHMLSWHPGDAAGSVGC
ncbi:hypothetical protein INT45_004537 [Circinella minor]|uniref:C2H2-type domain-containing protein n=2 Tax=Lichtheimiaceae TaxID=499202 RepID=A0A8H7VM60_9FUNG|nr:hypothetical protein INT45_004537 [Circinella minor]